MAGCGGGGVKNSNANSPTSGTPAKVSTNETSKDAQISKALSQVDWSQAISATYNDVKKQEIIVRDINISPDYNQKSVIISIIVNNAANNDAILDAVDTAIRRLNSNLNIQNDQITPAGGKDYWGGLYDVYQLEVRVATAQNAENPKKWLIAAKIPPHTQGNYHFTIRK